MGYMIFNIAKIIIHSIPLNKVFEWDALNFNELSFKITIASAVVTFIALVITILAILQSNKLKKQVEKARDAAELTVTNSKKIQELSEDIADYTRKPLENIEQVLVQIYRLVTKHKANSTHYHNPKFYYLGLTLGIGPVHETEKIVENWDNGDPIFKAGTDNKCFVEMYETLHDKLIESVKSENTCIVCLDRRYVYRDFIVPLQKRKYNNPTIPKDLHAKISEFHNKIVKVNDKNSSKEVRYIKTIPLQVMGAQINEDREAVIVFNVGTFNAESDNVSGFYSESSNMCKLFREYVETLHKYKPDKVNT